MASDGEVENGLGIFEKASGCQFFKGSSLARKSLKFCCNVDFLQEIAFNHLVTANLVLIT